MTSPLTNRRILLVISGGIAAYKSLDLIRRIKDEGAFVRCILTEGGSKFITPLSVSALSCEPVFTNLFSEEQEQRLGHIKLSRETDLVVVAPASANMMAKMAHGLADNLASAVLLASNKPILLAPAMNSMMWQHPATQANLEILKARGVMTVGPASGSLACGEEGAGRMSDPSDILASIKSFFGDNLPLTGRKALVTSGPTFEPLDPVRFVGNRSSGKQGHAIATELAAQGAEVTLVSGPTSLPDPAGARTIHIETAQQMLDACQSAGAVDVAVCAAAVADWRPSQISPDKLKKGAQEPVISFTQNPDILATLSNSGANRPTLVVGFAAETDNLIEHAKEKFARKGCDWVLANKVGYQKGFGEDSNEIALLTKSHKGDIQVDAWPRLSKKEIAVKLVQTIIDTLSKKG